jgi:hypothetical protein
MKSRFMSPDGGPGYIECVPADEYRALQRKTERLLETLQMIAAYGSEPESGVARRAVDNHREDT